MSVSAGDFKAALRRWASGVTIITARAGERVHGMTASAFSSVSAAPPLVLICAAKSSETHGVIAAGGNFAVHLLARGQEKLSELFADEEREDLRFDGLEARTAVTGAPLLPGALAALDCRVTGSLEAGDHTIYVGQVEAVETRQGDPLLYYAGGYRRIG